MEKLRGKGTGAVYTTKKYADILYKYLIVNTDDIQSKKFFDPTSGCGNLFLTGEDYSIPKDNFYGYELESSSVEYCRNLGYRNITECDSLQKEWPDSMDYVICNPPYLGRGKVRFSSKINDNIEILRKPGDDFLQRYTKDYKQLNYAFCWLIKCIEYIKKNPNTKCGFILPLNCIRKIQNEFINVLFNDIKINCFIQFEENYQGAYTKFFMIIFNHSDYIDSKKIIYQNDSIIETEFKNLEAERMKTMHCNPITEFRNYKKKFDSNIKIHQEKLDDSYKDFQYSNSNLKNKDFLYYTYDITKKGKLKSKYDIKNFDSSVINILIPEYYNYKFDVLPIIFQKLPFNNSLNSLIIKFDDFRLEYYSSFFKEWLFHKNINELNCISCQLKLFRTFILPKEEILMDKNKIYSILNKHLKTKSYQEIYSNIPDDIKEIYNEIDRLTTEKYKEMGYTPGMNKVDFIYNLNKKIDLITYEELYNELNWSIL